jgi:hypothetical protein
MQTRKERAGRLQRLKKTTTVARDSTPGIPFFFWIYHAGAFAKANSRVKPRKGTFWVLGARIRSLSRSNRHPIPRRYGGGAHPVLVHSRDRDASSRGRYGRGKKNGREPPKRRCSAPLFSVEEWRGRRPDLTVLSALYEMKSRQTVLMLCQVDRERSS